MGIQQLLLGGGPSFLTPEEALDFFYTNTTSLIALDINNVQSWAAGNRYFASGGANAGSIVSRNDQLFDFSVSGLSGPAASSNFTSIIPISYGLDEFDNEPGGNPKTFTDLNVTLNGGGVVTTAIFDSAVYGEPQPNNDFGSGIGIFHLPESVKNIDSLTLDINNGSEDWRSIFHTALFPGRWECDSVRRTSTTANAIVSGQGPFPAPALGEPMLNHAEWSFNIPAWGFALVTFASVYGNEPTFSSTMYYSNYATIPSGVNVAYERRPLLGPFVAMDCMLLNRSNSAKTVVWRMPWTYTYSMETESGTSTYDVAGPRWGAIYIFQPRSYFDVPDALGVPVSSGFLVAAENATASNPSITFLSDGSINKFTEAGDSTTNVWATPSNPVNGSYYYIRFTQTSSTDGVVTTVTGGALNTWIPLTSSVAISRTMPASGIQQTSGTVQISTTPSTVGLVSSGTYRLDAAFYSSGGSGGSGGGSVWVNSWLPSGIKVGEVIEGDELLLLSADYSAAVPGEVISTRRSTQQLVTLVSESGIRLTVSDNTPLTLSNGIPVNSTHATGLELPVQDENGFRWEKIVAVIPVGEGEVETIFCDNQCYAAGDAPGRYIWTHNATSAK